MPEDIRGAKQKTPGSSSETTSLPELNLVEIARSKHSVENRDTRIETILPWHNYTVVVPARNDAVMFFDEAGQKIEGGVSKTVICNWDETIKKNNPGKTHIFDGQKDNQFIATSQLEDTFRAAALLRFERTGVTNIPLGNNARDQYGGGEFIGSFEDGKYFVFRDKGHDAGYVVYRTENTSGIALPPRNWTPSIVFKDIGPKKLVDDLKRIREHQGRLRDINQKYFALITDQSINIFDSAQGGGKPIFIDKVSSVDRNGCVDPGNKDILYYCSENNPREIIRLDISGDPASWRPAAARLPREYRKIENLQLDPSGRFFLFYSDDALIVITKDGLEEVKRVEGLTQVNFDSEGRIRAINKEGYLVILEPEFDKVAQELDKRRVADLANGIEVGNIFDLEVAKKSAKQTVSGESFEYLEAKKQEFAGEVKKVLDKANDLASVQHIRKQFAVLRDRLAEKKLRPGEIEFIINGLEEPLIEKERTFATQEVTEALLQAKARIAGGISIATLDDAKQALEDVKGKEGFVSEDIRKELQTFTLELDQKSLELFRVKGEEIKKDVEGMLQSTERYLEGLGSKSEMDDWMEYKYPHLKVRLGNLIKQVPLEAEDIYKAITGAKARLQVLADTYDEKFKIAYAEVRQKATARIEESAKAAEADIQALIERLRAKAFTDRTQAEQYLQASEARKTIEGEIAALESVNPELARELKRSLMVHMSNTLTEIERGAHTKVAETGQQMILFGKTLFPKWEAKVKERVSRQADVIFEEDVRSRGPGIGARDVQGDIAVSIRTGDGRVEKVRLYEGWEDEQEWRLGLRSDLGQAIPPSYLPAKEYQLIKKDYLDWSRGEKSALKAEYETMRGELRNLYASREKIGARGEADAVWKAAYLEKLKKFGAFCAEHHVTLLRRIDDLRNQPDIEASNGKGFVPEWQSHWVMDAQTETYLEQVAKELKMQLELQEGILNLKGHAGTGKDVLVKMFCNMTHRPYFGTDCTKWTTEYELSEDIVLESEDGASVTVRVPSTVLTGIQTPGAIVYLNEFNAMPEQAQIFLHALLDEKRSLTLKTSSGKVVRAHPSVLLMSSMNPDYPGTFVPQFATRSRMISMTIDYPPLERQPDAKDPNRNKVYDSSEPLRIARGLRSLEDLTYEASLEHNEFVKMWDKYINGIENGAATPTKEQQFDIDTILALTQFANKLRHDFMLRFEKSRDARNALPVSQPLTGRELRRCAYMINLLTPEQKFKTNPEELARILLRQYFLSHIDKMEDREKVDTALRTWTSSKRVRA